MAVADETQPQRVKWGALLASCTLALAACGGGTDAASEAVATTATTAAAGSATTSASVTTPGTSSSTTTTGATASAGKTASTTPSNTATTGSTASSGATSGTTAPTTSKPGTTTSSTTTTSTAATPATTSTTTTPTSTSTATAASAGTLIGVNIHAGGGDATANQAIADVMHSRNLGTARMDFWADADLANWRDQVTRLKAYGIKVETGLQISYQWDTSCNQNFASVEQDSYNQTVTLVQRISDLVQDFELLNEVSLRPDTAAQVAPYQGTPASGYAGKSCYATMASVLRGMSRAIVDQRNASGAPLKIILGAVSNDFGFLSFMQQQGVTFDIVGYHAYPTQSAAALSTDPWFGPGGPIVQLAAFNKPVRVNEFNCGEIFASSYNNTSGSASNATCLAGIQKHLKSLLTQTTLTLQSVHAYELLDEPAKAAPENHFGLMVDLNTPKINLAAFALFAGGSVSSAEKTQLSAVGLSGL